MWPTWLQGQDKPWTWSPCLDDIAAPRLWNPFQTHWDTPQRETQASGSERIPRLRRTKSGFEGWTAWEDVMKFIWKSFLFFGGRELWRRWGAVSVRGPPVDLHPPFILWRQRAWHLGDSLGFLAKEQKGNYWKDVLNIEGSRKEPGLYYLWNKCIQPYTPPRSRIMKVSHGWQLFLPFDWNVFHWSTFCSRLWFWMWAINITKWRGFESISA